MTDLIAMAKRHLDADMLMRGKYLDQGKGCSIGCFNHDLGNEPSDHAAFAKAAGIPVWLANLQDRIFEGLSDADGISWHVECVTLYPKVKDFDKVFDLFLITVLDRVKKYDPRNVVRPVIDLLNRHLAGENVDKEMKKAASAARAAAYDAAVADADAARASAYFAAASAVSAAAYDASAASASAAADAASAASVASAASCTTLKQKFYAQSKMDLIEAMEESQ